MRKMAKWSVLFLALVILAAGCGREADVNPLAEWIPAESVLFVAYDGDNQAYEKTALHAILNEPEMKALLEGPLAGLQDFLSDQAKEQADLDTNALLPLLQTSVGVAFVGVAPSTDEKMPPQPQALLVVKVGEPDSPASRAVRLLVDHLFSKAGLPPDAFKPEEVAGVQAQVAKVANVSVAKATKGEIFVLGTRDAVAKALDPDAPKLAQKEEFQRVSEVTGGNEVFLMYYDYASFMQKLGPLVVPPKVASVLTDPEFGLANLQSVSLAVAPHGKGLKTSLFAHVAGEQTGILKLLAGKPLSPVIVELAPEKTQFFFARSLDAAGLWDFIVAQAGKQADGKGEIEKNLDKANQKLGFDIRKDFVGSLGDEFAVFGPTFTAVAKLEKPEKFRACLETILQKLGRKASTGSDLHGAQLGLSTMQYKGRTITYVQGRRLTMFIQPCYTIIGEYAVFAPYPSSLKEYIIGMENERSLKDNADFKAVRARIGRGVSSLYYANTSEFFGELYRVLPIAAGLLKMVPEQYQSLCPDPEKVPPFSVISKHLFGCVAGWRTLDDGLLWEAYSPVGVPTPPAFRQGGGVATTSLLASMLLPSLGRAREEAQKAESKSNLRGIAQATALWLAIEGGNQFYPPSLKALWDDGVIEVPEIFICPGSGTKLKPGKFVSDYESIMSRFGGKVPEEITQADLPIAWEKKAFFPGGRCVAFFDCHVEFVSETQFRQLMQRVDRWLAKHKPQKKQPSVPSP